MTITSKRGAWGLVRLASVIVALACGCGFDRVPAEPRPLADAASSGVRERPLKTGYAPINGLNMYYEIRGQGQPLVVLHGGFMMRIEQMADDVVGLLDHLEIARADVFGFSMGGMAALRLAMRYPARVRKLVVVSAGYNEDSFYPSMRATWPTTTAASLAGTPLEEAYLATAPDPQRWPVFVRKMMTMLSTFRGWSKEEVRSIKAPTLLIVGDLHDIRPEHVVELFRLLGGAPEHSRFHEMPTTQLAVLPGITHFEIVYRIDVLAPTVNQFLDASSGPPAPGPIMRTGREPRAAAR